MLQPIVREGAKAGGRVVVWVGKSGSGTALWKAGVAVVGAIGGAFGVGYLWGKRKRKN